MTRLKIPNKEMDYIIKILLEESSLLIKKIKLKNKKVDYLSSTLLGTLAAILLGNAVTVKEVIWAGERKTRTSQDF